MVILAAIGEEGIELGVRRLADLVDIERGEIDAGNMVRLAAQRQFAAERWPAILDARVHRELGRLGELVARKIERPQRQATRIGRHEILVLAVEVGKRAVELQPLDGDRGQFELGAIKCGRCGVLGDDLAVDHLGDLKILIVVIEAGQVGAQGAIRRRELQAAFIGPDLLR